MDTILAGKERSRPTRPETRRGREEGGREDMPSIGSCARAPNGAEAGGKDEVVTLREIQQGGCPTGPLLCFSAGEFTIAERGLQTITGQERPINTQNRHCVLISSPRIKN